MPLPAGFCGPVRRLAQAAQRMSSGGDLSVRIHAQGRDELARLVTSFNTMAAALEDKAGELQRMEARTPLTAMTAVAEMLGEHPGLTGDTAAAARLDESGQRNNDARHHPCRRDRN
jgi:methyl-accepting chemotaxis protein